MRECDPARRDSFLSEIFEVLRLDFSLDVCLETKITYKFRKCSEKTYRICNKHIQRTHKQLDDATRPDYKKWVEKLAVVRRHSLSQMIPTSAKDCFKKTTYVFEGDVGGTTVEEVSK